VKKIEKLNRIISEALGGAGGGIGQYSSIGGNLGYGEKDILGTLDSPEEAIPAVGVIVGADARKAAEAAGVPRSDLTAFFTSVMNVLGVGVNDEKLKLFGAWTSLERPKSTNNPLATTYPGKRSTTWKGDPGMTTFNSAGVKNFSNFESGVNATVATINNGYYPHIVEFLEDRLKGDDGTIITTAIDALANQGVRSNLDKWGSKGHKVYSRLSQGSTDQDKTFISKPGVIISENYLKRRSVKKIEKLNRIISEALAGAGGGIGGTDSYANVRNYGAPKEIIDPDSLIAAGTINYTPNGLDKPVSSKAQLNETLKNAWQWLSPILPDGAILTSGCRTQANQDNIIRDYANKNGIPAGNLDNALAGLKAKGYVISRWISKVPGRGHGGCGAMDISGAPLDDIKAAVEAITSDPAIPVVCADFVKGTPYRSIVERTNNACHIEVRSAKAGTAEQIALAIKPYLSKDAASGFASNDQDNNVDSYGDVEVKI
jgi:hypothetical protein